MDVYEISEVVESFLLGDDFYHIPNFDTYVMDKNYIEYRVVDNSYDDIELFRDFEYRFNEHFRGQWMMTVSGNERRIDIAVESY